MKLSLLADALLFAGFRPGDQKKDLGEAIPNVGYFYRGNAVCHTYVSLVSYSKGFIGKNAAEIEAIDGEFVEAVLETYLAPKSRGKVGSRKLEELQKMGLAPLATRIARTHEDVLLWVLAPTDCRLSSSG